MTIREAIQSGPIVAMLGTSRSYVIGDVAHRFFPDDVVHEYGMCYGRPVTWRDDEWRYTQSPKLYVPLDREITLAD